MTREIRNKPHPTPNPEGPHAIASGRGTSGGAGQPPQAQEEPATDEPNYDSCMDDLNVILSEPLSEPDPFLKSKSSSDTIPRAAQDSAALPSFLQERGKQPGTSEIFRNIGPQTIDVTNPIAGADDVPISSLTENSPDPETLFEGNPITTDQASLESDHRPRAVEWATDDDQGAEPRIPWALILVMSYSSAVTLALTWVLWTGRSFRSAAPTAAASQSEPEPGPRVANSTPAVALPPLPADNVVSPGATVRLGDLEATAVEIVSNPLNLVRSIEPSSNRRERSPVLVLRLRFKNISENHVFAPLEPRFVREQTAVLDRSSIVTSQGQGINLFPLAVDSEWAIVGQKFTVLKPGDTMETIVASEPDAADRLTDEMTWRLRLRTGPYRTDVLGVRFNKNDVRR